MSVLAQIRNRAGLLVTVIGVALLLFVLQEALSSRNSFKSRDNNVGVVAGKEIPYLEFNPRVQNAMQRYKEQQASMGAAFESQIVRSVWERMVEEIVLKNQYEKLGLSVGVDELYDLMVEHPHSIMSQLLADPNTGKPYAPFADANGNLDPKKIKEFIGNPNITPDQDAYWKSQETVMRDYRLKEKYLNLIKAGMYTTTAQAKMDYVAQNKSYTVRYIGKRYTTVPDSTIKVTDDDIRSYYNKHQNDFKQDFETRNIDYVSFEATPSAQDIAALKEDATRIASEFKEKKSDEDSSFVFAESDVHNFDGTFHKKGTLSPLIDSIMFKESANFVYGPYEENNTYKIAKLIATKVAADSAKVRHILIGLQSQKDQKINRTKEQAKTIADSLTVLIKDKKRKFEDLVKEVSDDAGSIEKGGDYGWFNATTGFVEPFKDAGLLGKKGDLKVVETQFGYHIIEVLDRSKTESKLVQVAIIEKKIEPSDNTKQSVYAKASEFAGKNNSKELFDKAVADQKINKRVATDLKLDEKNIPGLESARDVVKWAYDEQRKVGEVSDAYDVGANRFVVAVLTQVREKGVAALEIVKEQIEPKAREDKKAELFIKEMETAMSGVNSIDELAKKTNLSVEKMDAMYFNTYSLPGYNREDVVVGTATGLAVNKLSKPLQGKTAVFVVVVDAIKEAPEAKELNNIKTQTASGIASRAENEVLDALKDKANITDNKGKFY